MIGPEKFEFRDAETFEKQEVLSRDVETDIEDSTD